MNKSLSKEKKSILIINRCHYFFLFLIFLFSIAEAQDSVPPSVFITYPHAGQVVYDLINVNASAFDNIGIANITFFLDSKRQYADTSSPYTFPWNASNYANGTHTLTATAYDTSGNANPHTITVTVDDSRRAADVTRDGRVDIADIILLILSWGNAGATDINRDGTTNLIDVGILLSRWVSLSVVPRPTITGITPNSASQGSTISAVITGTNLDGASSVIFSGSDVTATINSGGTATSLPLAITITSSAATGPRTFAVITPNGIAESPVTFTINPILPGAFDFSLSNSGNIVVTQGSSVTNTITATLVSGVTQLVTFTVSGLPAGATATPMTSCSPTCTSTLTITTASTTPAGSYVITVTGTAGILTRITTFTLTVNAVSDTIPPTISITSPTNGATVSGTTTVSATASDNVGVTKVEFLIDGVVENTDFISPYSFSWDTTIYSNGAHTLTAKAYDAANNVGTSTAVSVTVNNVVAACSGNVMFTLTPNSVGTSGSVTPSASGLTSCSGKTISFKQTSCSGTQVSSCTSGSTGCTGSAFTAPAIASTYTYFACIDKNADGDFADAGESNSELLTVTSVTTFRLTTDLGVPTGTAADVSDQLATALINVPKPSVVLLEGFYRIDHTPNMPNLRDLTIRPATDVPSGFIRLTQNEKPSGWPLGRPWYQYIRLLNATNVVLENFEIIGPLTEVKYNATLETSHGVQVAGNSSRVTVRGVNITGVHGDFIYLSEADRFLPYDILFDNISGRYAGRQGVGIGGVNGTTIRRSSISFIARSGVDVEPSNQQGARNILVEDSYISGYKNYGLSGGGGYLHKNVTLRRVTLRGGRAPVRYGILNSLTGVWDNLTLEDVVGHWSSPEYQALVARSSIQITNTTNVSIVRVDMTFDVSNRGNITGTGFVRDSVFRSEQVPPPVPVVCLGSNILNINNVGTGTC